jgi:antitoxin component of MazEF toxin-antitoxin module
MSETPQILSIKPIRRWGHSRVVSVSKEVRAALKVEAGDQIVFRKVGRYVFILAAKAFQIAPVTKEEIQLARAALG